MRRPRTRQGPRTGGRYGVCRGSAGRRELGWPWGHQGSVTAAGGRPGVLGRLEHCRAGGQGNKGLHRVGVGQADRRGHTVTPEQAWRTALWPGRKAQSWEVRGTSVLKTAERKER